ncbi:aspartate aminotransferase family protein [Solemya pervernicosa gill symbiont]|uniref:Acetylornithine aminotransferase n=2 Tax=Gammaproteobacteria incertae sedis TaxID=118884 RepID=A0A1T2L4T2_9GAMM|nr:acetylornithine transaminase [Candidatus Reidiella endopervernicosa]OOZ40071.1 aspartate aminotransferase family protein [Solemya pervernicosa gill symbiont]QKQ27636.1 acetylornithine transaminase [Candidatus Reidiella endopervernicosa]
MNSAVMNTYGRLPVAFTRGEGCWLWDEEGNKYLDGLSGIAVCGLGHAHPAISEALCDQANTLIHTSNLYGIPLQSELAEQLTRLSGMENAFFCNSGAEANEAAIKIARLYGHQKGIQTPTIVVAERSFHGRTLATLTATGNRKVQAGFEPLVNGFARVIYNDIEALETIARNNHDVVAVLIEPVQGESGVRPPDADYLAKVRALCNEHDWLMMLDEVQTGIGRTGKMFAFQHDEIVPDVLTLAKGLGNGVPIGTCLANGTAAEVLQPGNHGSTFGGNPLACRAALTVLDTIERESLAERAEALGERILNNLSKALGECEGIVEYRGKGLMIGVELDRPCGELVGNALKKGLLINVANDTTVRLLPPLIMSDEEADQMVDTLAPLITDFCSKDD